MPDLLRLEIDEGGRLACDLPCGRCGYNVRTLPICGVCPECGLRARTTILRRGGIVLWWLDQCRRGANLLGRANQILAVALGFICCLDLWTVLSSKSNDDLLYAAASMLFAAATAIGPPALIFALLLAVPGSLLLCRPIPFETGLCAIRSRRAAIVSVILMPILLCAACIMSDRFWRAVGLVAALISGFVWLLAMHIHVQAIADLLREPKILRGSRFLRRMLMSVIAFAALATAAGALASERPALAGLALLPATVMLVSIGLFYLRMSRCAGTARWAFRWALRRQLRELMEAHRISEPAPPVESVAQTGGPLA